MQVKFVAMVPMKANSERVPNKNIRDFGGKPLCLHILETLAGLEPVQQIIVNTDSDKIAAIASEIPKVKIHPRPREICGGHIPMNDIIAYDLENSDGEYYLQTHCTNPLVSAQTLLDAMDFFADNLDKNDSLLSVTPIQQRAYTSDLKPVNHNLGELKNTQDLELILVENSCIYIFTKNSFKKCHNRIGARPAFFRMNQIESCDIDTEEDFQISQYIYLARQNQHA